MKKNLVVLTGAGISAESGIQTFRDSNGLWENNRIEDVATLEAWKRDPELIQCFYNQRRLNVIQAKPNKAHFFLSDIQQLFNVQIITQNIDDLHERAGSKNVLHLHGNIRFAKSSGPNQEKKYYPIEGHELKMTDLCDEGYPLRPHVVWFGEEVPMMDSAIQLANQADIFLVIGTSLQVYPAAGLSHYVSAKALKILVDPSLDPRKVTPDFTYIQKQAGHAVEDLKIILSKLNQ